MSPGAHRLEIAAVYSSFGDTLESPKSSALNLVVTAGVTSPAAEPPGQIQRLPSTRTSIDGTAISLQILTTALIMPSAISVLPDGAVLIAETSGNVRVWRDGMLLNDMPFRLSDSVAANDVGLIGMTLDPSFSERQWLYIAYTVHRTDGHFANRIVRVRVSHDALTEPVVLLEDPVPEPPSRTPRLRFGPDRKLYVAFPASRDQSEARSLATYAGKILRLNDDGTTPRDNARYSPILSNGHRSVAFDWAPATNVAYLVERGWDDVDRLVGGMASGANPYTFESVIDASDVAFYGTGAMSGFRGNLFIAALNGQHIRRVRFDPHDAGRVWTTERLVDFEFGRISDVTAGPDGALYFCTANTNTGSSYDQLVRIAAPPRSQ
jgi:glucose/arabinose dehydrogenase